MLGSYPAFDAVAVNITVSHVPTGEAAIGRPMTGIDEENARIYG